MVETLKYTYPSLGKFKFQNLLDQILFVISFYMAGRGQARGRNLRKSELMS